MHIAFLQDRPVTGWSGVSEFRIRLPTGALGRIIRFDWPASDRDHDEPRVLDWVASLEYPDNRLLKRRAGLALPPPDTVPFFYDLRTGRDTDIWLAIAPYEMDDGPLWTRWLRLSADGQPLAWILAPQLEVLEFGPDALLALDRDEFGVHRVALHPYDSTP